MWSQNSFFPYADFNFSSPSPTSSPPFPPSFPLRFPNYFHRKRLEKLSERFLKPQKNLPEKPPRKDFPPLPLPEKRRETVPENPLFLGFLKGAGEEDKKRNPEKREKTEMPSMTRNGFKRKGMRTGGGRKAPCGEEDTHKALIFTLFLLPHRKN